MTIRQISLTALLAALLLTAVTGRADEDATEGATMDHAAMASSYQAEAKAAQAKAAEHEIMLKRYKKMPPTLPKGTHTTRATMVQHCQKLVDSYNQAAAQATDLAKLHQQAAEASK